MAIRAEVGGFVATGPLPSEDAPVEAIERAQHLLEQIGRPVTDEEAALLATSFGPDDCYGLAWTLLHLIETAPGAQTASYDHAPRTWWVEQLTARVAAADDHDRDDDDRGRDT